MLSYTWGYEVGDIADSIRGFCNLKDLDTKTTCFWLCCLCINQHRVKEAAAKGEIVPFSAFQAAFAERVTGIGKILAMMQPWDGPRYVERVWCDFEMYTATSTTGTQVEVNVTMPPREAERMMGSMVKGNVAKVFKNLAALKIQHAEASVPEDKEHILALIKGGPGFHTLNNTVAKYLKNWIVEEALKRYDEMKTQKRSYMEMAKVCKGIGHLTRCVYKFDAAQIILKDGIEHLRSHDKLNCKLGATLLRYLATVQRQTQQLELSMATLEECKTVSKEAKILHYRA
eukprot:1686843-Amphidinium_carterae.1